ncbi:MAG: FKBP-type peptidyl-prolyl cis-trans isomerase [Acidimicrobiales bacterium]|nr:FKBP-type peptidyl-prolyl cis-trans isomerase [Acidimicrobiales bacterium]
MSSRSILKIVVLSVFGFAFFVSCGSDGDSIPSLPTPAVEPDATQAPVPTPTPTENIDNTDMLSKPFVQVPEGPPPEELLSEDIVGGSGDPVAAGDFLIMEYVGVSYSTGLQFDSSWDRGEPFAFELGAGKVISGWDEGIAGMSPGGRRLLIIPPGQAYGENGSGSGSIGPNETLIFIVDLLASVPAGLEKPDVLSPLAQASSLGISDISEGTGREVIEGDVIYVHYVGRSQSTDTQFDASWDRGRKEFIGLIIGQGQVIAGWEEGLIGMKVGGRRELVIPPDLAYGEDGAGNGLIAPNETLIFVVDLLGAYPYSY